MSILDSLSIILFISFGGLGVANRFALDGDAC